jgi:excisionase family DNA binding protein
MLDHTQPITEPEMLGAPLLSLDELAAWTQTKKSTLYSLLSQGRGPRCSKVGRALRFRASDVDTWISGLADTERANR